MILLLAACTGSNDVTVKNPDLVPFEVGRIRSALFLETRESQVDQGRGTALLLMSDQEVGCDAFKLAFGDEDSFYNTILGGQSSLFSDATGVVAVFSWRHFEEQNAGWEGAYPVFSYSYTQDELERSSWLLPFQNEETWIAFSGGYANIDGMSGGDVEGDFETRSLKGEFDAEYCGQMAGGYYQEDSGR